VKLSVAELVQLQQKISQLMAAETLDAEAITPLADEFNRHLQQMEAGQFPPAEIEAYLQQLQRWLADAVLQISSEKQQLAEQLSTFQRGRQARQSYQLNSQE
jgi:predicted AAA+ superfamily ATPase